MSPTSPPTDRYPVGRVAALAGTTVRTLHHYERVGLLRPSARTAAGYRQYTESDLDRLTRILYYRDLGFALTDIAALLDGTEPPVEHLARQHRLLTERLARVQAMVAAIEKEMTATMSGTPLTPAEKLEIFGHDYDPSWEAEAEQRWGDTTAWQQSSERTARFSRDDWRQVKADGDAFDAELVRVYRSGADPDSAVALALAERHRAMVGRFYDCSYPMHRGLADMYLADERFTANYERQAAGLAQWIHDAIHANADAHGAAAGGTDGGCAWRQDPTG